MRRLLLIGVLSCFYLMASASNTAYNAEIPVDIDSAINAIIDASKQPVQPAEDSWRYLTEENEFVDGKDKVAMVSDGYNLSVFVVFYTPEFQGGKKPIVSINYTNPGKWVTSFCFDDCDIYLNIDGKKLKFKAEAGKAAYFFKEPLKVINAIKNA